MKEALEELTKDFEKALSGIDFKRYDPFSKPFMKALFIGQVWMAVKMLEESDDVEEELDGARKYWNLYSSTGDVSYKEMASDELRHAGTLIKKKMATETDPSVKSVLNEHEKERGRLMKAMSAVPAV